jgi:hypothetical protein
MSNSRNDVNVLLDAFDEIENSTLRREVGKLIKRAVGFHVNSKVQKFAVPPPHPELPLPSVSLCNEARLGRKLEAVKSYRAEHDIVSLMEAKHQIEWGINHRF